jgi:1,4-dihydroxy-2-naphthoate octaprenyltransferase
MPSNPWLLAARPHTLPAAVAPVLVGAGLAAFDGAFRTDALLGALVGALAIQVAANFANDASDAKRGADPAHRIGPARAVASGLLTARQVWTATWVAFAVAALAGIWLTVIAGWVIVAIGIVSILATLGYVGGPLPYGYRGLGELFVFVFFGLVATVGSRFVHDSSAPASAWLLAIPMGCLVTAILVANNVRDIQTDAEVGKRTLAVIIGRARAVTLFGALVAFSFISIAGFAIVGATPIGTIAGLAATPLAFPLARKIRTEVSGPPLVAVLKGTARLQLAVAVLISAGLLVQKLT